MRETQKIKARDVKPYHWALRCTFGGDPTPVDNEIVSVRWSEDGKLLSFMLDSHNFYGAAPDEMLDLVPMDSKWGREHYGNFVLPDPPPPKPTDPRDAEIAALKERLAEAQTELRVVTASREQLAEELGVAKRLFQEANSLYHGADATVTDLDNKLAASEARAEALQKSMAEHFQRDHLSGDGPEIDRWKARAAKLAAVVHDAGVSEYEAKPKEYVRLLVRTEVWEEASAVAESLASEPAREAQTDKETT
jgi:hypothetical protein